MVRSRKFLARKASIWFNEKVKSDFLGTPHPAIDKENKKRNLTPR
jgi:hypothetical protein